MANFEAIALKYLVTGGMEIIPELHPDLFTERHNKIYLLCLDYFDTHKHLPNMVELKAIVEAKAPISVKPQYLATVENIAKIDTSGIDIVTTITQLRDLKVLREVDDSITALVEAQRDKDSTKVRQLLNKLSEKVNLRGVKVTDLADAKDDVDDHAIVHSYLGKEYDHLTSGHTGLVIYGAKSGGGKSIALLQTAVNNYLEGNNVLFVSLELSRKVLYNRLLSMRTGIDFTRINSKTLTAEEQKLCIDAHNEFFHKDNENWFKIVDDHMTDAELTNLIAVKAQLDNVHVVCIDYLNLISFDGSSDEWRGLSNLAKKLHRLTRTYPVCIVSAAQVNIEGKTKGSIMPNVTTRGSKELEFSASQLFYFDIEPESNMLVCYTKKNRIAKPSHFLLEPDFAHMKINPTDIILQD